MNNNTNCEYCGKELGEQNKFTNNRKYCNTTCRKKAYNMRFFGVSSMNPESVRRFKLLRDRGKKCEICGLKVEHECQLDIDHIDGNSKNNNFSNLQILCANCHRLKTWKNKDWRERKVKLCEN